MKDQVWTEMCVVLFVFIFFKVETHKLKAFATKKMLCAKRHLLYSKIQYVFQPTNNMFLLREWILAVKHFAQHDAPSIIWVHLTRRQSSLAGNHSRPCKASKDSREQKLTEIKILQSFWGGCLGLSNVLSVWTPFSHVLRQKVFFRRSYLITNPRKVWLEGWLRKPGSFGKCMEMCFASLYAG